MDGLRADLWASHGGRAVEEGDTHGIQHSPLVSLSVRLDTRAQSVLPQHALLGFNMAQRDTAGNPEPVLINTNTPGSVFLCGSQGSGKSYTLSAILENHVLAKPQWGNTKEPMPGYVFHYDTNSSGSLAEAASLCSQGMRIRVLVSWSNYREMKRLYENYAEKVGAKGRIEVRPLLFDDSELTIKHIMNLMAFNNSAGATANPPVYLSVIEQILRSIGRNDEQFNMNDFLWDIKKHKWGKDDKRKLEQRLELLKHFSASEAPWIFEDEHLRASEEEREKEREYQGLNFQGPCITVEKGVLTIMDLSDPFVSANTASVLFDICLGIIIKRHREEVEAKHISPGLIITIDEAHKFLDKSLPAAEIFTQSIETTIREQRHNGARIIIATQEPTISTKLLDLCSVSIVHRFSSPAWLSTLREHLSGASAVPYDQMSKGINELSVGDSLVFAPTSYVCGGDTTHLDGGTDLGPPSKLGSQAMHMRTRQRAGRDAGGSMNVVE